MGQFPASPASLWFLRHSLARQPSPFAPRGEIRPKKHHTWKWKGSSPCFWANELWGTLWDSGLLFWATRLSRYLCGHKTRTSCGWEPVCRACRANRGCHETALRYHRPSLHQGLSRVLQTQCFSAAASLVSWHTCTQTQKRKQTQQTQRALHAHTRRHAFLLNYSCSYLPSPKLTSKLIEGPKWRIVVLLGAPLHFHVNLGECTCLLACLLASPPQKTRLSQLPELHGSPAALTAPSSKSCVVFSSLCLVAILIDTYVYIYVH